MDVQPCTCAKYSTVPADREEAALEVPGFEALPQARDEMRDLEVLRRVRVAP